MLVKIVTENKKEILKLLKSVRDTLAIKGEIMYDDSFAQGQDRLLSEVNELNLIVTDLQNVLEYHKYQAMRKE